MDWYDELEAPLTEIVEAPIIPEEKHQDIIRTIENELHMQSAEVVHGVLAFTDINPSDPDPPKKWVKTMGEERARKRMRLAQAGWMNAKEAPVALKVATQTFAGIVKARATEKSAPRALNVQVVQMSSPVPLFPELEVEK